MGEKSVKRVQEARNQLCFLSICMPCSQLVHSIGEPLSILIVIRCASVLIPLARCSLMHVPCSPSQMTHFSCREKKKKDNHTHEWRSKRRMRNRNDSTCNALVTSLLLCTLWRFDVEYLVFVGFCHWNLSLVPWLLVSSSHCGCITKFFYFCT